MKKNKLFSDEFIKTIVQILLILFCHWFINSTSIGNHFSNKFLNKTINEYEQSKIKDDLIIIFTLIMYFFIQNILKIISQPVHIKIKLEDYLSKNPFTQVVHFTGNKRRNSDTVKIEINVLRSNSIWNKIALKLLENKTIKISIELESANNGTSHPILNCQPTIFSNEIEVTQTGFKINIKNIINDNLKNDVPIKKESAFLITEGQSSNICGNGSFPIKPRLIINDKSCNLIHKIVFNFCIDLEEGYYPITYIK